MTTSSESLFSPPKPLREQATRQPLGVDISDFSDEFCEGFLRGQVNALDVMTDLLRGRMNDALGTHGVGEMTELLAQIVAEVDGV